MTDHRLLRDPGEIVATGRPLIVVDVDEVILRFVGPLTGFLATRGFALHARSFALTGNVTRAGATQALPAEEVKALIAAFFEAEVERQAPVEGAIAALGRLSARADVVILTNVPAAQAERRARHLARLGVTAPVLVNDGAKGPMLARLARAAGHDDGGRLIFVDDGPNHLASARVASAGVRLVHFVDDPAWFAMAPEVPGTWLRSRDWGEVERRIAAALDPRDGARNEV